MANDSHSGKAAGHLQLCRNDLRVLVLSDDAPACVTLDALTAEEHPFTSIGFTKKRFSATGCIRERGIQAQRPAINLSRPLTTAGGMIFLL